MPLYYNQFNKDLTKEEQKVNAAYIWDYLKNKGFTLNAVSGMLGNFQAESLLNPNIVEKGEGRKLWDSWGNYGYGLAQWTPWYTKKKDGQWIDPANYHGTNKPSFGYWAEKRGFTTNKTDGGSIKSLDMQLDYLAAGEGGYHKTATFPYTFDEFKALTIDAGECAKVWYVNYERSRVNQWGNRPELAQKWFEFLGGITPPVPTSTALKAGRNKTWLVLHLTRN